MLQLEEPQVARVMVLADLLETCKFKQFWEELAKCGDLIITVQGFEDAIRKFVAHVVNITYQTIEVPVLKELLGNVNGKNITCVIKLRLMLMKPFRSSSEAVGRQVQLERSRQWTCFRHVARRFGQDQEHH